VAEGKPLVIYHAECQDGFCAAWLYYLAFPGADFHAAHYGTEPPDCTGRQVHIVDFSYKRPVMRRLLSQAHKVVVLDHHKTAQEELAGLVDEFVQRPDLIQNPPGSELPEIVFDMDKSGGRLAWEYLYSRQLLPNRLLSTSASGFSVGVPPWLVAYTEDQDLWHHTLPNSKAVNAALRTYPLAFDTWDDLLHVRGGYKTWDRFLDEGVAVLRAEKQAVDQHVKHAREIDFAGFKVLCVNATVLFSEIAGRLAEGRPFGACYFDRQDGKRQWSLRSRDGGIDVAKLAADLGGGGHRNAAGFETSQDVTPGLLDRLSRAQAIGSVGES
jgi:uncharacterized protein